MFDSIKYFRGRLLGGLIAGLAAMALLMGVAQAQNQARMALLLPDNIALTDVRVSAWIDAAQEEGYALSVLRNAELLSLGVGVRSLYSGIIVPDQVQVSMSDALVSSIQSYVQQGGHIMLVYDAGALTDTGFYAIPKSRFSDLVGVDYTLYDQLRDQTVGLGPVVGAVSTLRGLMVPPGKSMLFTPAVVSAVQATSSQTLSTQAARTATPTTAVSSFLPTSPSNPGGLKGYEHNLYFKSVPGLTEGTMTSKGKLSRGGLSLKSKVSVERTLVPGVTVTPGVQSGSSTVPQSQLKVDSTTSLLASAAATDPLHSVSGYVYGALTYPSFVTQGVAQGEVLLSSPDHGVVASDRVVGSGGGSVLFVNLPLTYLKLSEDAMLMHGFLHRFAGDVLHLPRLTAVPDGIGGLVFNWHLDSKEAEAPIRQLKSLGVWNYKPFSIHITAGPDTIVPGDKLGFDLPNNRTVQKYLKDFVKKGHQVGNHGGWIHDYYGNNANESNQAEFEPYLVLNRNAVQAVTGQTATEYSAPQGNNPLWSLNWLQGNSVVGYYSLSHTGTATTRTYRAGQLMNPSLWAVPVTPFGVAATFEEFEDLGFSEADILQWYKDLMDFASDNETNRMIYAHPPGAMIYPQITTALLQYAQSKQTAGTFRWYTMTRLAQLMSQRAATTWTSSTVASGRVRVTASNTSSNLTNLTWVFPKSQYAQPQLVSGNLSVVDQGSDWMVRILSGKTASFEAMPLQ